jgi:hypothetical protein
VHNQDRRDVVVEEDPRNATRTVRDLKSYFIVLLVTLCEVTPELGRAVLVGVDDPPTESPELGRDNLEEILEHVVVIHGLKNNGSSVSGGDKRTGGRTTHSVLSNG